jgi:hypothetical protein
MEGDIIMDIPSYLMGRRSGGSGGATIEVVTELPEIGEANVIYLVPKQDEDENNVFDEYLYINNEWELIGTTDIDLSNYYTKSEINRFSPIYDFLSTTTATTIPSTGIYLPANDLTALTAIVNEVYLKGQHSFGIHFSYYENSGASVLFASAPSNRLIQMKPTTYDFMAMTPGNASLLYLQMLRVYMLRIEISWNNDTATVTSARVIGDIGSVLSTKNESSYTPTGDYNPATKKYVDDSIAAAITTTLGGSF